MKRYSDGVKIDYSGDLDQMVSKTSELIKQNVDTIFQAAFFFDNCYVISDLKELKKCRVLMFDFNSQPILSLVFFYFLHNLLRNDL